MSGRSGEKITSGQLLFTNLERPKQCWHRTLYGSDHTDEGKEEAWVDPLTVVVAGNCCICRVAQRESERRQPEVGGGGGGYAEEVSRPVECTAGRGRPGPGCGGHHHCQLTTTPHLRHRPNSGPSEPASWVSFLQNDIVGLNSKPRKLVWNVPSCSSFQNATYVWCFIKLVFIYGPEQGAAKI